MKKRYQWKIVRKEMLIIATVIFLFLSSACLNKMELAHEHMVLYALTFASGIIIFGSWIWLGTGILESFQRKRDIMLWLDSRKGVLLVMLYCFVSRVVQLTDRPRWDSLIYYRELKNACENFDFSLKSFIENFSLADHPTLGVAGIAAIGEFWDGGGYMGMLVIQMILNLLMAFCVYRIVEKMLSQCSWIYHTVGTCVILSTPLTLGTFSYFQPDAGTVYFFVFMVYCYLYNRNLLMFFSMLLLVLSKEVGIIALGGFGLGAFGGYVLFEGKEKTLWKRFLRFWRKPLGTGGIFACFLAAVYLFIYLKNGGNIWSISNDTIAGFSTVSFQPDFIIFKWKQFFVLNFNWLVWGSCLILTAYMIILAGNGKGILKRMGSKDILLSFAFAAAALIIFYCSYITFALPRYHVLADFCAVFIMVILLGCCLPDSLWKNVVALGLMFLFLIEAYITIDPISLSVFETDNTGNGKIIMEQPAVSLQGEFSVYNHQFNYLNKVYRQILADVEYDEGMDILIWDGRGNYSILDNGLHWDILQQKIMLDPGDSTIPLTGITKEEVERQQEELNLKAVFLVTEQFGIAEDYAENFIRQFYEIRYKGKVEIPFGGTTVFYVCDLLGQEVQQ